MLNLFKAIDVTVWFNSAEALHKFEETIALNCFTENNIRKVNNIEAVVGGFEDGHVEATFPIKRNKVAEFKKMIVYFGHFFESICEVKLVG